MIPLAQSVFRCNKKAWSNHAAEIGVLVNLRKKVLS